MHSYPSVRSSSPGIQSGVLPMRLQISCMFVSIGASIITIGSLPIVAFMAGAASIPRSRRTCPMTTRNIWSGTAIVSAGGRIRSDQTHERRLMQSLPPAGSNSSHTGAVWGCCGCQTSILPSGLKKPVSVQISLFTAASDNHASSAQIAADGRTTNTGRGRCR